MKRVLLLTYYVPPRAAVATVRVNNIMTSLRRHNWDVVPVVPDFGDVEYQPPVRTTGVIDFKSPVRRMLGISKGQTTHERFHVEPSSFLSESVSWKQQAIKFGHRVTSFANGRFGWIGPGTRAVAEILREERFDAIISTSPPETTHLVASRVAGDIPWIADLRDPWVRNDSLAHPGALGALDRLLEPRTLRAARALTTVSEPLAAQLRERHPGKRVYAVPNAFSEDEWTGIDFEQPEYATFLHAGQLYQGRCNPRPFFAALAFLLKEGLVGHDEVRVDLYGDPESWLEAMISQFGLRRVVRLHGKRPRAEILRLERRSSRNVIFVRNGPEERGTYTGKLFEYFGARRKIVAVGGPDESTVMDEALEQSGAGRRYRSERELRDTILETVREWRSGITSIVSEHAVAPFELTHFGDRFARILDEVTESLSIHGVT